MTRLPNIGDRIIDLDGKSWRVSSAWSGTIVLTGNGEERVVRDEFIEQLYQAGPEFWNVLAGENNELLVRQKEAIKVLLNIVRVDGCRADDLYASKYQDVLAQPIYDALKKDTLKQQELEKQRLRMQQIQRELAKENKRKRRLREKARQEEEKRRALIKSQLSAALSESLAEADELNDRINAQRLVDYS